MKYARSECDDQFVVDRGRRRAQRLGDNLTAVQPAPRITRADPDVRVWTMRHEVEHARDSMNRRTNWLRIRDAMAAKARTQRTHDRSSTRRPSRRGGPRDARCATIWRRFARNKPKRGRKRTTDSIKKRLDAIDEQLKTADPLTELRLVQERRDLTTELEGMQSNVDLKSIEDAFVKVAGSYSERQGISYASWREVGVHAAVLSRAGITRGS